MEKALVVSFLVPRRMLLRRVFTVLHGRRRGGRQRLKQERCRHRIEETLLPYGDSSWEEAALRGAVVSILEIFKTSNMARLNPGQSGLKLTLL